ncbi:hypothetical protein [Leifsonia shinshuensis]|uniref:Prenyltransferase n=1 Tax=Leifsonia shinshuensis TaxID=150026 RepID=A0A853CMF3_9MICO|nr:hypothetical protein [Leifsonia shinshuensis]NYJ21827.1 hypothetical protein [Leifsonia shinshuensis]
MSIDLSHAAAFLRSHARVLDRRRFQALVTGEDADRRAVIDALDAYRNSDGGYGWGLEPDLRAPESQPGAALHALEAIADAGPATSPRTTMLLDWLDSISLPDGGLPFALPIADPTGCAPFWVHADPAESSLQITAAVAAQAYRAARWDRTLADHPWVQAATRFCFEAIRRIEDQPFAYVLSFALQFLDAASDAHPEAAELLDRLARFIPSDGALPVEGGAAGETVHLASEPGRPLRQLLDPRSVVDELDRLERAQQPDGGWPVDFASYSAAAALEWRGYATIAALTTLRADERWPSIPNELA